MGSGYSSEEEEIEQSEKIDPLQEALVKREVPAVTLAPSPVVDSMPGLHCMNNREQGDGMEKEEAMNKKVKVEDSIESLIDRLPLHQDGHIELPETGGLVISKLPPIIDLVDLKPPPTPSPNKCLIPDKAKVYPKGVLPPVVKKQREPRFVPYEPYRGAVAVMEGNTSRKPSNSSRLSRGCSVESQGSPAKNMQVESAEFGNELERNYRAMLEAKEDELDMLRTRVEVAEQQLKIQTKVNSDVKQLLVASVGEDIEARVDFLTQDKARLAADVLQYSNRVASDWEAKEALGVESDIWRSKYLASSVIVEEIERTRQAAVSRSESLEYGGRKLLLERGELRCTLAKAQQIVNGLASAFDPLSPGGRVVPEEGDSILAASNLVFSLTALSTRLVGSSCAQTSKKELTPLHCTSDTPAEAELKKLLGRPLGPGRVPQDASTVLAKNVRPHLMKLGDKAGAPHRHGDDGFKTCSHCSGTVHVV